MEGEASGEEESAVADSAVAGSEAAAWEVAALGVAPFGVEVSPVADSEAAYPVAGSGEAYPAVGSEVASPVAASGLPESWDAPAWVSQVVPDSASGAVPDSASRAVPAGEEGGPATVPVGAAGQEVVGEEVAGDGEVDGAGRLQRGSSPPERGVFRTATEATIAAWSGTAFNI